MTTPYGQDGRTILNILTANTTHAGNLAQDDLIRSMLTALAREPRPRPCIVPPNLERQKP